eukprot:31133-Pelagococcus_subviridis.AAC.1
MHRSRSHGKKCAPPTASLTTESPGKVLKDRRPPRERGRTGTSVPKIISPARARSSSCPRIIAAVNASTSASSTSTCSRSVANTGSSDPRDAATAAASRKMINARVDESASDAPPPPRRYRVSGAMKWSRRSLTRARVEAYLTCTKAHVMSSARAAAAPNPVMTSNIPPPPPPPGSWRDPRRGSG